MFFWVIFCGCLNFFVFFFVGLFVEWDCLGLLVMGMLGILGFWFEGLEEDVLRWIVWGFWLFLFKVFLLLRFILLFFFNIWVLDVFDEVMGRDVKGIWLDRVGEVGRMDVWDMIFWLIMDLFKVDVDCVDLVGGKDCWVRLFMV